MEEETIVNRVKELVQPLLASRQAELVELTYRHEGARGFLRFLVDTPPGIRMDQLSGLNQAIGAVLDEHDLIPEPYTLEVSSPGLDRPLKAPIDFERVIGRRLRVLMSAPVESRWEVSGELAGVNEEAIVLKTDIGEKIRIPLSSILKAAQEVHL